MDIRSILKRKLGSKAVSALRERETLAFEGLLSARDISAAPKDDYESFLVFCATHMLESAAQLFQDLFVLHELREKRGGFFVEFGATNGIDLSNSYLLQSKYGWTGILAEPARCWRDELARNRAGAAVDNRCVWEKSGDRLNFTEASEPEYSTVSSFADGDHHVARRASGRQYQVETVSLNDLLAQHNAPQRIDYLSIDTEGTELSILRTLDFQKYRFEVISVEHNFTKNRNALFSLLVARGYQRKFVELSSWDDWYVKV